MTHKSLLSSSGLSGAGLLVFAALMTALLGAGCIERIKGLVQIQEVPAASGTGAGMVRGVAPPIPDSLKGLR